MREKTTLFSVFIWIFFLISFSNLEILGEQNEKKEIELNVRVRHNNHWVSGLGIKDFRVFENGKLQKVHAFFETRKYLGTSGFISAKVNEFSYPKARQFLIIFFITDFNADIQKGIDYLFDEIMKANDHLSILVNNMPIKEHRVADPVSEKQQLKSFIQKVAGDSGRQLENLFLNLEALLRQTIDETIAIPVLRDQHPWYLPDKLIKNSEQLNKYVSYLNNYKKRFLIPSLHNFPGFTSAPEVKKTERWVIQFFQMETFPLINFTRKERSALRRIINDSMSFQVGPCADSARQFKKSLDSFIFSIDMAQQYPDDEMARFFYRNNTTFHSVLIPPSSKITLEDEYFKKIFSDFYVKIGKITRLNGGEILISNNAVNALKKIVQQNDIIYSLVYTPAKAGKKKRKIKIDLDKKGYELCFESGLVFSRDN